MKIGARLKELRNSFPFTQGYVANIVHVTRQAYSRYENDEREPNLTILCQLADLFECSVDYILSRKEF